jgi:uncharacterized protein (DUF433 family)
MTSTVRRLALLVAVATISCPAYSVLSHEALVDSLWDVALKPALLARFPQATQEQLREAHGYAYGGAIIQDEGYYPHSNGRFSDLTHYVRSADFIRALVDDSTTLNEYAFALGALAHYYGDGIGHRLGTNLAEPFLYPKLRKKYGRIVTYEEAPADHLRTEFGFDVEEVAKGNYASQQYHDFIGFQVATELLQKAFRDTYGFELSSMLDDLTNAIGSYRHTVSQYIPFFTRVAWAEHKNEIQKARPGITEREFVYILSRSSYEHDWGKTYKRPSLWDDFVAFFLKLLPPLGPLKAIKFKPLTPQTEQIFMHSFDLAAPAYGRAIVAISKHHWEAENINFDLGTVTHAGEYRLQDEAYAYWVDMLARNDFQYLTAPMARDILRYYQDLHAAIATKKHAKEWNRLLEELQQLKLKAPKPLT